MRGVGEERPLPKRINGSFSGRSSAQLKARYLRIAKPVMTVVTGVLDQEVDPDQ